MNRYLEADTLWGLVRERAAVSPDATMLIDATGLRMSFAQYRDTAERFAAGLHALGIRPGMVVSWQLPTSLRSAVLMAALARLGVTQNPIIHLYGERESAAVLARSGAAFHLVGGRASLRGLTVTGANAAARLRSPPQVVALEEILPQGDPATLPQFDASSMQAVRWIFCTSGTSAEPKGACHADVALLVSGRALAQSMGLSASDVGTIAFPIAHIGGAMYLSALLASGASAVLLEHFVPAEAMEVFARHCVTVSGGSTAHYQAFLAEQRRTPDRRPVPTLRVLAGGGAPKPPELYFAVRREMGVPIVHAYGMTEAPLVACAPLSSSDDQLAHADGVPLAENEVRIVCADGSLAPTDVDGEIRIRGPVVCKGYTDPRLDEEIFDADGFFRTGDVGRLRADGRLAITGRIKEIIIRKGENISARELEDVLYTHPKVAVAAVIGLPDPERGERVCAVVELHDGVAPLTFDEMVACCEVAGLMRQKIPEQLEILERIPRSDSLNKIQKQKLLAIFTGK
jgi:acyl-CoA synthetase (AMP-forming)/AMP-acid ligase II